MKCNDLKKGQKVYCIDSKGQIDEWIILSVNPANTRFYIVVNMITHAVSQVHWKVLEYGEETSNIWSISKEIARERAIKRFDKIINRITDN